MFHFQIFINNNSKRIGSIFSEKCKLYFNEVVFDALQNWESENVMERILALFNNHLKTTRSIVSVLFFFLFVDVTKMSYFYEKTWITIL